MQLGSGGLTLARPGSPSQAVMGGAWGGMSLFMAACKRAGLFGFLLAFILGFMVYGAALTAATVLLKWLVIGRMPAGVHKCAPTRAAPHCAGVLAQGGPLRVVLRMAFRACAAQTHRN